MITLYWALQYAAVLCGYVSLLFVWPRVVFYRYLTGKGKIYQFSFCVTVQLVLINTVVLVFGLVHILNRWTIMVFFYGAFLIVLMRRYHINGQFIYRKIEGFRYLVTGAYGRKRVVVQGAYYLGRWMKKERARLWIEVRPHLGEYVVLVTLTIFGMMYFSYGAFQDYSYGFSDLYVHHNWIYGLVEGKIFIAGVYPEAMHCFIYCMHVLFGIKVYSSLLFLGGIHIATLLFSVYALLREVFSWRYTPFFVLVLFLTIDVLRAEELFSMSRLQCTLPQEFGMYTQFLCALYLIRYLKYAHEIHYKRKVSKFCWDRNLFVFIMAIAASISIHFYITIMAVFICISFALFGVRKVFSKKRFVPLLVAALCGLMIAVLPMAGALASGIPFQGSIGWALSVMDGSDVGEEESKRAEETNYKDIKSLCEQKVAIVYKEGYETIYGTERARWIVCLTGISAALWFLSRLSIILLRKYLKKPVKDDYLEQYPGVIFASVLFMVMYVASSIGLPTLIESVRLYVTEQILILSTIVMPIDILFSLLVLCCKDGILQVLSLFCTIGVYVSTILLGVFHGYLHYELTRYNAAVTVTNSIIQTLPQYSYTIVSPTDELYSVIEYGRHEELLRFVEQNVSEEYTLPTEYVFLYIEKSPFDYAQHHLFSGPIWLAAEKYDGFYNASRCPEVQAARISTEAATQELNYANEWLAYTELESRTVIESKAYDWCQRFSKLYPLELNVYYEDEDFVCYYFRQEPNSPYNLAIK